MLIREGRNVCIWGDCRQTAFWRDSCRSDFGRGEHGGGVGTAIGGGNRPLMVGRCTVAPEAKDGKCVFKIATFGRAIAFQLANCPKPPINEKRKLSTGIDRQRSYHPPNTVFSCLNLKANAFVPIQIAVVISFTDFSRCLYW